MFLPIWQTIWAHYLSRLSIMPWHRTRLKPKKCSLAESIRHPFLCSEQQLAQFNVSLTSSYSAFIWMPVYPGPHTSIPLYPKLANVCIFLSDWREQVYHHTNYYIFTRQQPAQFLSMLPQFGESVARKLSSWNQYKKEQYISSSTLPVACHILTCYLLLT